MHQLNVGQPACGADVDVSLATFVRFRAHPIAHAASARWEGVVLCIGVVLRVTSVCVVGSEGLGVWWDKGEMGRSSFLRRTC